MPVATLVLANCLVSNGTLKTLVLDGNALGKAGIQAVVASMQRCDGPDRDLSISFDKCDCQKRLGLNEFDPSAPGGVYEVDLATPYGQMVAETCFFLANTRPGCDIRFLSVGGKAVALDRSVPATNFFRPDVFVKQATALEAKLICYAGAAQVSPMVEPAPAGFVGAVEIMTQILTSFAFKLKPTLVQDLCRQLMTNWHAKYKLYIYTHRPELLETDSAGDGSNENEEQGAEEEEKFRDAHAAAAAKQPPQQQQHRQQIEELEGMASFADVLMFEIFFALFQIADDDKSGLMSVEEFVDLMKMIGSDLSRYSVLRMMREFDTDNSGTIDVDEFTQAMVNKFCRVDRPRGSLVVKGTPKGWTIPAEGKCVVNLLAESSPPSVYDSQPNDGIVRVLSAIKRAHSQDARMVLFQQVAGSPYFFLDADQGRALYEEMTKRDASDPLYIICAILPQLLNPRACLTFIDSILNEYGKLAVRLRLGASYCAFMGNPTGHYHLRLQVGAFLPFYLLILHFVQFPLAALPSSFVCNLFLSSFPPHPFLISSQFRPNFVLIPSAFDF